MLALRRARSSSLTQASEGCGGVGVVMAEARVPKRKAERREGLILGSGATNGHGEAPKWRG
jgi:hypothetical protein